MIDRLLKPGAGQPKNRGRIEDLLRLAAYDKSPTKPKEPDYSHLSVEELNQAKRDLGQIYRGPVFGVVLRVSMQQSDFKPKGVFAQKTDAELLAEIAAIESGRQPSDLTADNQLLEACLELLAEVATVRLTAIDTALKSK